MGYEVSVEVSKCIEEVSELILFIFFLIFSDTLPIRYRRSIGVSKYRIRIGIRVRQVSEVSVQPRFPDASQQVRQSALGEGERERESQRENSSMGWANCSRPNCTVLVFFLKKYSTSWSGCIAACF